jgi:hypothetical protein
MPPPRIPRATPRPVTCYICPLCGSTVRLLSRLPFREGYSAVLECPEDGRTYSVRVERGAARTREA